MLHADDIQQRFAAALNGPIEQVKGDRSILAVVLCGSLSHDTVWKKSDIDLLSSPAGRRYTGVAR